MPRQKKQNEVHSEIERKFLVLSHPPETVYAEEYHDPYDLIEQIYLLADFPVVLRMRTVKRYGVSGLLEGISRNAVLTMKTRKTPDDWQSQQELEAEIPLLFCRTLMWQGCFPHVEKMRCKIGKFDFDRFINILYGLKLLEIELTDPNEEVVIPEGFEVIEVTNDPRFRNENLAKIQSEAGLGALIESVVSQNANV